MTACKNNIEETKKFSESDEFYVDISKDIKLSHREKGYTDAVLVAPLMHKYYKEEDRLLFPEGFELTLYENGSETATIHAEYGEKNEMTKMVTASKNVRIVNYKNEIVETDTMSWNETQAKIIIDGKVKITTPTEIISGYGLISDDRFKNYKMSKITGILEVEDNNIPK